MAGSRGHIISWKYGGKRKADWHRAHKVTARSIWSSPASDQPQSQQVRRVGCCRECWVLNRHPTPYFPGTSMAALISAVMHPDECLYSLTTLAVRCGQRRCKWRLLDFWESPSIAVCPFLSCLEYGHNGWSSAAIY